MDGKRITKATNSNTETISTNTHDYQQFSATTPKIKPIKLSIIADTGAQSSLMGIKLFKKCGFNLSDLLPVKKKMLAANNKGIKILGVFARILTALVSR